MLLVLALVPQPTLHVLMMDHAPHTFPSPPIPHQCSSSSVPRFDFVLGENRNREKMEVLEELVAAREVRQEAQAREDKLQARLYKLIREENVVFQQDLHKNRIQEVERVESASMTDPLESASMTDALESVSMIDSLECVSMTDPLGSVSMTDPLESQSAYVPIEGLLDPDLFDCHLSSELQENPPPGWFPLGLLYVNGEPIPRDLNNPW